jgi:hypothetical protein
VSDVSDILSCEFIRGVELEDALEQAARAGRVACANASVFGEKLIDSSARP